MSAATVALAGMNSSRAAQVEIDPLGSRAAPPQPRSYAYQDSPARPYCSNGVVFAPSTNGSSVGGTGSGVEMKKPVMPCRGDSGVGGVVQPPMPGSAEAVPGAITTVDSARASAPSTRTTARRPVGLAARLVLCPASGGTARAGLGRVGLAAQLVLCLGARGRAPAAGEGCPTPERPASRSSPRPTSRTTLTRSPGRR